MAENDTVDRAPFERPAELAHGLADANRLRILRLLQDGEQTLTGIMQALCLKQPLASHHTAVLMHLGMVNRKRSGRFMIYSLGSTSVEDATIALTACVNYS